MKRFGATEFESLLAQAGAAPRLRRSLIWHASDQDPVQRFFNLMLPGSYVRPHRHTQAGRSELTLLFSGAVDLLIFDDAGTVLSREALCETGLRAVELPPGIWHSYVVVTGPALMFEVKQGPYDAAHDRRFADWSPAEGSPDAARLCAWLSTAATGSRWDQSNP